MSKSEQKKFEATVKKMNTEWTSKRDTIIADLMQLNPNFDINKLLQIAHGNGLNILYDIRNEMRTVAEYNKYLTK